jgi:hypothetical protein
LGISTATLARGFLAQLLDLDTARLADMDASNVDVHLLSLTAPGVQMFEPHQAVALARLSNDRLSEAIPTTSAHRSRRAMPSESLGSLDNRATASNAGDPRSQR